MNSSALDMSEEIAATESTGATDISDLIHLVAASGPEGGRELLRHEEPDRVRAVLLHLGSARVLDLLVGATDSERSGLLASLPPTFRSQWESNAHYEEQSVGRFMDPTEATLPETMTVREVIDVLAEVVKREFVTYGFVLDQGKRLVGVLVMRDLLFAKPDTLVSDIMLRDPFSLLPETSLKDAMRETVTKHFPVYPITNQNRELLGVVRGHRFFEAQAFEISAQAGSMVGVEKEERLVTSLWRSFRLRHPWLQLNLITAFAAGLVVSYFQDTIDKLVILAAFLPVLAGQSGNTGCQALAVTLRGMTLGDYKDAVFYRVLRKEALLGAANGFLVGIIAGAGMYLMASSSGDSRAFALSLVVLGAMTVSCMISGVSGVAVPVVLRKFGFDPATASSIFLTTATDVASMGMLLGLAAFFLF